MPPLVSVVVPVLDDAEAAAVLLRQIPADPRIELVLVDGDSDARLDVLAGARADLRLMRSAPGRGRQMNAGAGEASAPWLLFLHADSRLPPGWIDRIAALPGAIDGGWFRFALDDAAWQARLIERGVAWRVRLFGLPYGDQGLLLRRDLFLRHGGYREMPLMEDVEFVRRLRGLRLVELPLPLVTSARRWRRDGWLRRRARNTMLLALYFAGFPPGRLAAWYGRR
jgi:rSAM/selenodomain-associated transferase 2